MKNETFTNELPGMSSLDAEQAVLGSCLIDGSCARDLATILRPEDFAGALHQETFRVICQMQHQGKPIDGLTVASEMRGFGEETQIRNFLTQLYEVTPTSVNAVEYANIVLGHSKRRNLLAALRNAEEGLGQGKDLASILGDLETVTDAIDKRAAAKLISPEQLMETFWARREAIDTGKQPYARTGFRSMDKLLGGGLQDAGFYTLAARPGMGKTTLAMAIARHVALFGAVLYITLEMDDYQLASKWISSGAKINYSDVLSGTLTEADYKRIMPAANEISKTPIYYNNAESVSVEDVAAMARSVKNLRMVVIDHFQLLRLPGKFDRTAECTVASGKLKALARSLGVPILCLSQLNRENERRPGKEPALSDMRDTGALEQDSDGVILLHRPDYYHPEEIFPGKPSIVKANIAKNRHGSTGVVDLSFFRETGQFRESFVR